MDLNKIGLILAAATESAEGLRLLCGVYIFCPLEYFHFFTFILEKDEIHALEEYMRQNLDMLKGLAKDINPIRSIQCKEMLVRDEFVCSLALFYVKNENEKIVAIRKFLKSCNKSVDKLERTHYNSTCNNKYYKMLANQV